LCWWRFAGRGWLARGALSILGAVTGKCELRTLIRASRVAAAVPGASLADVDVWVHIQAGDATYMLWWRHWRHRDEIRCWNIASQLKPGPHQQQCRSNVRLCRSNIGLL